MSEDFVASVSSDRQVEQALVALKKGAHLLKYGRRGKPKFFRLSTDEKFLIWYSGQEERQLRLTSVTKIIHGQRTTNFQRQLQPERESQSFSIIYANGQHSLDLICKDKAQADSWCLGLRDVIARCQHFKSLGGPKTRRVAQSCVNSPAGYMRRKHNLGLSEGTINFSQVRSLSGSPTQSISERCFSDGLSCSSDSFYSESSLSSMQHVVDIVIPNSPYIYPDDLKKQRALYPGTDNQMNMLSGFDTPTHGSAEMEKNILRDVLIWGEGMVGGCFGGGLDKFTKHNEMQSDALFPKLLESTMMLDVQNLALGAKHAALVTKQGEVFCWGDGSRGKLGNKVNMHFTKPTIVESLCGVHVKSAVCGEYQTCALTFSGELYTWGDNCYGANLGGKDSNPVQWLPRKISGALDGVNVSQVACGEWHMAIVTTSGQLFTYGDGTFGVLGHGNLQSISQPREVESLRGLWVKCVACGPWHTAAIVEIMVDRFKFNNPGGKLFTWGDGDKGRLGHADQERKLLPTCVAQLVDYDFLQVSCGRMLTVALSKLGKVYTMGSTAHGQLGNPQAKDKLITIVQGKLKNEFIREISSGSYHVAALASNGNVYTWGKGMNGQLGLGDTIDRNCPTLVEALRDRQVESITCGSSFTAAICLHKSISSNDQSACRGCGIAFGFTRKKHNCYNCGLLFCHACSSKKAINASLAPTKNKYFRVCDPCFQHLTMITHSGGQPKLGNRSPRLLLSTQMGLSDGNVESGEPAATPSQMSLTRKSSKENGEYHERKNTKSKAEIQLPLGLSSLLSSGLPRWGQVTCPLIFKDYPGESRDFSAPKKQLSLASPIHSQQNPLESSSPSFTAMNVEKGFLESDRILTKEIQKLRAELHTISEKLYGGKETKDQVGAHTPQIKSIPTDSPTLKAVNRLLIAIKLPPEVGPLEDRKVDSLCSSPIVFSNTLKSMCEGEFNHGSPIFAEEPVAEKTDSRQNGTRTPKIDRVEKYEPGVYITFINLPNGKRGLKRVRFSRKRFTEGEAEKWWEENQASVYHKYEIEEYIRSNQDKTSG
ncbi:PH, RCC1 and FYVE domains-containing protein 1 isoform X2 [Diospyros lotus]|uniref:PH, RCC1 and FYVE domains-containing protein 1 isoform X2 n=1 Tax=Diospyros lotus TaxID=55363 RepID=UPI0022519F5E|nr:PH, RCC1 and FYVE domains-containing protein 1 isoform X2 [Diospyros lotus]